jgi:hypothetical protein
MRENMINLAAID